MNLAPACPTCSSEETRRTSRKGLYDRVVSLFNLFPWECTACGHNFRFKSRGKPRRRSSNSGKQFGTP